jgi:hypothetical protein
MTPPLWNFPTHRYCRRARDLRIFYIYFLSNIEPATTMVHKIDIAGGTFSLSMSKNIAAYTSTFPTV